MNAIDLNGKRMAAVSTDPQGVVSAETILTLEHTGSVVRGRYGGGSIVAGYLVGRFEGAGFLRFVYAQADVDGRLDAGISTATFEKTQSGRLRLIESFQWLTRPDSGINVFEETD